MMAITAEGKEVVRAAENRYLKQFWCIPLSTDVMSFDF
jgi:hypothetical protein